MREKKSHERRKARNRVWEERGHVKARQGKGGSDK